VSYETIRAWCDRFGQEYANQLRRRGPRLGDTWQLDEVFVQTEDRSPGHPPGSTYSGANCTVAIGSTGGTADQRQQLGRAVRVGRNQRCQLIKAV
jgi:hypothetical protein